MRHQLTTAAAALILCLAPGAPALAQAVPAAVINLKKCPKGPAPAPAIEPTEKPDKP